MYGKQQTLVFQGPTDRLVTELPQSNLSQTTTRQYFGGMVSFEHKLLIHPDSTSRWRTRIGEKGAEELLKQTIDNALYHDKNEL